ncbi:hypothetical protein [uncultured Deefgea sp.]|uniref:hypothetical protein n=1 Tax=uncultured Deefgea sp. TaxID=1304914 RepID=UPI002613E3AB|nr:hypothetical protein [uncultured Deefgea sp.]
MKLVRAIEVWEKGMEGAFIGHLALAETVPVAFLFELFAAEQDQPDPEMKLSYLLDAPRIEKIQAFVSEAMDSSRFDFILTAYGLPDYQ